MSAISITDTSTPAAKVPGETLTFSFSASGGSSYEWNVAELASEFAVIDSGTPGTGTGSTFTFDGLAAAPGAGQFLVQLFDPTTGQYDTLVVDMPVSYAENEVFTSTDSLDETHAYRLNKCDAGGGAFNITIDVDPAGLGMAWWGVKNSGSSNNVTVKIPTGKKLNGVTNGTQVLTPGQSVFVFSNNSDGYDTAGGP